MSRAPFPAVRIAGNLVPASLLPRVLDDEQLPGRDAAAYNLAAHETVREAASRAFDYLSSAWAAFTADRDQAQAAGRPLTALTRDRWLSVLLQALGYGVVGATPAGGITVEEASFPVSHRWTHLPVHLLGWGTNLDHRTPGVVGAARTAPQSMVQELLNRSDDHLWALLSNGRVLRLLRDSRALAGSAHLEFDLELIFSERLFSDFVLLYRMVHASRFAVPDSAVPDSCLLEMWRSTAVTQGERALEKLRGNVEQAINALGTGFLRHRANTELRARLADGRLGIADYNRAVLRLVYRLLFWFVVEDRELLPNPQAAAAARDRYHRFFSSRRLRDRARRGSADQHHDLWNSVTLVFTALGTEAGVPALGLPGLGGLFARITRDDDGAPLPVSRPDELDAAVDGLLISNEALLAAVRHLAIVQVRGQRRTVDFRSLASEELGSVYESLLELHPHHDAFDATFTLEAAAGNERKTTGSYYTPSGLAEALLDSTLEPALDRAVSGVAGADDQVAALLGVTVCDPACGSGHFLVAAARRIARRVAQVRSGEDEPGPDLVSAAMREVVSRCIHGVDINEMAVELAKVSLWMESVEPGRPLAFLDTNLRVGNSLLGTTPALLEAGVPDAAFTVLTGDARDVTTTIMKENRAARAGQGGLFELDALEHTNTALGADTRNLVHTLPESLSDLAVQRSRLRRLDAARREARRAPDAWCAAFVQPKTDTGDVLTAITDATLRWIAGDAIELEQSAVAAKVEDLATRYRFFHWHLEFPHIFTVPADGSGVDEGTGWRGGFGCVIGNPPWDSIELQEKSWFVASAPDIAKAATTSKRKKMIEKLAGSEEPADLALYADYLREKRYIEGIRQLCTATGRYPLTARGRLKTDPLFAEIGRTIIEPRGQVGMVLPTGIATDSNTQFFFADMVNTRTLVSVYDFENEEKIFPAVHNQYRFCLWTATGRSLPQDRIGLAFRLRQVPELGERRFTLTPEEIRLLNPNTGTCPVFDYRRNAEITLGIYGRVPVLWLDGAGSGNPWRRTFSQGLFNMSSDSNLFRVQQDLEQEGWELRGNVFERGGERMLPLYEAKMLHHFDSRFSTYDGATQAQLNKGTLPQSTPVEKDDPRYTVLPRYWVPEHEVEDRLVNEKRGWNWTHDWLLGWRDICRSSDVRTLIPSVLPHAGVGHTFPLMFLTERPAAGLYANLSSLVLDFVARQKMAGTHLTFGYVNQLPVLPPAAYVDLCSWSTSSQLGDWVTTRVLELAYTSHDMAGFARNHGDTGLPFRWNEDRRFALRAELDAAYFHLYGVARDDLDYVLDTFRAFRNSDPDRFARTKKAILEVYDDMATAIRTGAPYASALTPPPGHGPRHPSRSS